MQKELFLAYVRNIYDILLYTGGIHKISLPKIRPFVSDEFKDITCPQPIYTGNE